VLERVVGGALSEVAIWIVPDQTDG
jgi:hypothetical protein